MKKFPSRKELDLDMGGFTASEAERLYNDLKKNKRRFFTFLLAQDLGAVGSTNNIKMSSANTSYALEAAGKIVAQFSDKEIEEFLAD